MLNHKNTSVQFRVRAVNKEGESDPLSTDKSILAKNPYEVPGKIEKPQVTDWDKDHADLEWKPPADDGGAPIEAYVIEQKDEHGRWEEVRVGLTRIPRFRQIALIPGDDGSCRRNESHRWQSEGRRTIPVQSRRQKQGRARRTFRSQ